MSNKKMITRAISAVLAIGITGTSLATVTETTPNKSSETNNQSTMQMGEIEGLEKCYGVAKAGLNDCGTTSHACAGESKMNNEKEAWINVPSGVCNKIAGGSTKAPEKA